MTGDDYVGIGAVMAAVVAVIIICIGSCKGGYEKNTKLIADTLETYKHNYQVLKDAHQQKSLECVWKDKEIENLKHIVEMQTKKLKGVFQRHPDEAQYRPGEDPELGDTAIIFIVPYNGMPDVNEEIGKYTPDYKRRPATFKPDRTIEEQ